VEYTPRCTLGFKRPADENEGMIPKSGYRFSEKIMPNRK